MRIENVDKAYALKKELEDLQKILKDQIFWKPSWIKKDNTHHFEFVENYGLDSRRVRLSQELNQRILDVLRERAEDIEDIIKSL